MGKPICTSISPPSLQCESYFQNRAQNLPLYRMKDDKVKDVKRCHECLKPEMVHILQIEELGDTVKHLDIMEEIHEP